jgi:hypothetical protein
MVFNILMKLKCQSHGIQMIQFCTSIHSVQAEMLCALPLISLQTHRNKTGMQGTYCLTSFTVMGRNKSVAGTFPPTKCKYQVKNIK